MAPGKQARTAEPPTLLVGFEAEAQIARLTGWPVVIGGGTTPGAASAARMAIQSGAPAIVSFGLAGGLDPSLPAGTLVIASEITTRDGVSRWFTDPILSARLGGQTGHVCLGTDQPAASVGEKQALHRRTGAALVDMESMAVAEAATEAGIPFAVLRAICDPADRDLPPAALVALTPDGKLAFGRLVRSILLGPGQIGALLGLARDAAAARRVLRDRATRIAAEGVL